jgi:hypothetical protein
MAGQAKLATLSIVMLPALTLQSRAQQARSPHPLPPPSPYLSCPAGQPLAFTGQKSTLLLSFCSLWDEAAHSAARALFIPSVSEFLGPVACGADQKLIVSKLLASVPSQPQLYPPHSWQDLTCHKDRVHKLFGDEFMLPAQWLPIANAEQLPAIAAKILTSTADGWWMLKGSFSANAVTAYRVLISRGQCTDLSPILHTLFHTHHQRCVGIQLFLPELRSFEMRVYLVPDAGSALGWRQTVSLKTSLHTKQGSACMYGSDMDAELLLPTHGRALLIAGFIDKLLTRFPKFFTSALQLETPILRLDCGFIAAEQRCFLNEIMCAVNACCYSHAHGQEIASVVGRGLARGLWKLMES